MQVSISKAREVYRPVAVRGSLLYFLVDSLNNLDRVYHYSMAAFVQILKKGGQACFWPLRNRPQQYGWARLQHALFAGMPLNDFEQLCYVNPRRQHVLTLVICWL